MIGTQNHQIEKLHPSLHSKIILETWKDLRRVGAKAKLYTLQYQCALSDWGLVF
jgi:hypothetical protein